MKPLHAVPGEVDGSVFLSGSRLLVKTLVEAMHARWPMAVDPGGRLYHYEHGLYRSPPGETARLVGEMLGDHYTPAHLRNVESFAAGMLRHDYLVIEDEPRSHLLNLANGMLDPIAGTLHQHHPRYLSTARLQVMWDPAASCPHFDAWLASVLSDEALVEPFLEDVARVLDARPRLGRPQKRAVFLYGPTRSGKSTLARLLSAIVGDSNASAVTLHDLSSNRFAGADLFGKILNVASDLRADHVEDVGVFKMASGDDLIRAERKHGQPFTFRFCGLFVFTANTVPTVADRSGAYLARVRPYCFPTSFVGAERPDVELAMMEELPGIVVRLVEALRRFAGRAGYGVTEATERTAHAFAQLSDRVLAFLDARTEVGSELWVERRSLYLAFESWCQENRRAGMSATKFYEALDHAGYVRTIRHGARGFRGLQLGDEVEQWGDDEEARRKP